MKTLQSVPYFYDPLPGEGGGMGVVSADEFAKIMAEPDPAPASQEPVIQNQPAPTPPEPTNSPDPANPPASNEPTAASPTPPAPVATNWKESVSDEELLSHVSSKFDKNALLKSLGVPEYLIPALDKIDPETVKYAEYVKAGGNANDYLRIKNTDYNSMGALQLMELDIQERYPQLQGEELQLVIENELRKYHLDRTEFAEDSKEAKLGQVLLKQDADQIKAKYLQKQEGLKAPAQQPDTKAQEQAERVKQLTETVRKSVAVKDLQTKRELFFGEGEDAFRFELKETDGIVNQIVNASLEQGKPLSDAEVQRLAKTVAYHNNQEAIEKGWVSHLKSVAEAAFNKEIRNVQPGAATSPVTTTQYRTNAEALAKEGKLMTHAELFGG